ncbi:MAG: outer membrane protein assembly factor BamB family protein [Anaerolineae bacterium]
MTNQHGKDVMRLLLILSVILSLTLAIPVAASEPLGTFWDVTLPDIVYATAISADGALTVFGGRDGVVYAYDAKGTMLWSVNLDSTIRYVAVAGDGARIFAATEDRNIVMLDNAGNIKWTQQTRMPPVGLGCSKDGSIVVVGEEIKPRLTVYDGASGELQWRLDLEVRIASTTISSDGKRAYTGSRDAHLVCFDIATQKILWDVQLDRIIYAIAVPGDGAVVLAGGDGRSVIAVDGATGATLWVFTTKDRIASITATEDASLIASGSWDGNVYLLNKNGELLQTIIGGSEVHTVSMSANGEEVIAGTNAGRIFAVNLASAKAAGKVQSTWMIVIFVTALVVLAFAAMVLWRYIAHNVKAKARLASFGRTLWKGRLGYLFLLPTFILLIIFNYYPSILGLGLGFTEWSPGQPRPPKYVGLYNFGLVLQNPNTLAAVRNVLVFAVSDLAKTLVGPLLIAELIYALSKSSHQYTWRTLFIIILVVPGVASILMWTNILDPNLGLINNTLFSLGLASPQSPPIWLGDKWLAMPALIFIGFPWIGAFPLLIYYGGLINISTEIVDAARVDGASGLKRVLLIDIPLLMPQIRLLTVLSVIGSLQQFQLILLTTRGGPGNATTTPVYEMYIQGIMSGRYGYAAALASMLFVVIMAVTLTNIRVMREKPLIK